MARTIYRLAAYISLGLGMAGMVLPLLPTTPFVLLAAWCAGRSSPAFETWLKEHRTIGPVITGWRERGAVPMRGKVVAPVLLSASWLSLFWMSAPAVLLWGLGFFFAVLALFLWSRPSS